MYMFQLNWYKEELINYYRWEIDNSEEEINKRRKMLEGKDEYLSQILSNTEEFIYFLLTKMKEENHTYENHIFIILDLEDEKATTYFNIINLNLHGGWPSDKLFRFNDKFISFRVLQKVFENFYLECKCVDEEVLDGDIGRIDFKWQFYISGPIKDFNQLYEKLIKAKRANLINTLKRIRTN